MASLKFSTYASSPIALDEDTPLSVPCISPIKPLVEEASVEGGGGSFPWYGELSPREYPYNPDEVAFGWQASVLKVARLSSAQVPLTSTLSSSTIPTL